MKIICNVNEKVKPVRDLWSFGFNTCHAPLWLREDLPSHALKAHRECGFKYVRFHNIISLHTGIYSEDGDENVILNFEKFDKIFDKVIACGLLPFLEIGYCPKELSNGNGTHCNYYEAEMSPPSSYEKWNELIYKLVLHCIERYGAECVRQWYFEVWNEPDLNIGKEDYLELYKNTVLSVKKADNRLRVGGPATSKCLWVDDFIEYVEKNGVPCDFISTHAYPSDLAYLDSDYGDVTLQNSNIMYELYSRSKQLIEKSSLKGVPFFMGEWNSSAGPFADNHDEKNNAAFIVKMFDDLSDIIDGSLYWNLSDIYQEQGFHYIPFHGGYGMININDIPKSSYNAFLLLSRLEGDYVKSEVKCKKDGCGIIPVYNADKKIFRALMYYYTEPESENNSAEDFTVQIPQHLSETLCCDITSICDEGGSAYEWWIKQGSPEFINRKTLAFLEEKSKMIQRTEIQKCKDGMFEITVRMNPGDVAMLEIELR